MKHYTMKDVLASYTPQKRASTSRWAKVFSRPLSFLVSYVCINIGMSANLVSIISIFVALIASTFLIIGEPFLVVGVLVFLFWDVLDCTDGNIARMKHSASVYGEYLDAISGYTAPAFIYLAVGTAAYHTTNLMGESSYLLIVFGAIASVSDILSRIIYQKYAVTEYKLGLVTKQSRSIEEERKVGIKKVADVIMQNLTYSSLFMPLLVIALITKHFDILIILYMLYCLAVLAGTFAYFIIKILKLAAANKEN